MKIRVTARNFLAPAGLRCKLTEKQISDRRDHFDGERLTADSGFKAGELIEGVPEDQISKYVLMHCEWIDRPEPEKEEAPAPAEEPQEEAPEAPADEAPEQHEEAQEEAPVEPEKALKPWKRGPGRPRKSAKK